MKKIGKSIVLIMTVLVAAGIFSLTGKMSEEKVYADDTYLDIEQGKTVSLDLNKDRTVFLGFKPNESCYYEIYSTGSNDVDCELRKQDGSSYNPQIIDRNSGSYYNFKLKVYLEKGKEYRFKVYLTDVDAPVNANDTKVRIDKYVDKSEKVVDITTKNFPDIIFRVYVGNELDTDGDGYLSRDEISNVKNIEITYDSDEALNVKSVKGIEYLTSLESLNLKYLKDMSATDLSKNTSLKYVNIYGCDCPSVNLKNLTRLLEVEISYAPIKSIDLSSAVSLRKLNVNGCSLTSLDLTKQTELNELDANGNGGLVVKNLNKCSKLTHLELGSVGMKKIDLTGLRKLRWLFLSYNELTSIDLSPCSDLYCLQIYNNNLSSINLKGLKELCDIYAYDNKLKSIDLSDLESLETLSVYNNPLTKLDISKNPELCDLIIKGCDIKTLDISYNLGLQKAYSSINPKIYDDYICYSVEGPYYQNGHFNYYMEVPKTTEIKVSDVTIDGVPVDEEHFPDKVLRKLMERYDFNNDGVLKGYELRKVTFIRLEETDLQDLSGIEYLPCLDGLSISGSKVTSLDISKCPNIVNVYAQGNQISSVKLNNPKLVKLLLANNQIKSIDLSKIPSIEILNVSNNKLSSLNLSGKSVLSSLSCFGNNIKTLDIIDNPELKKLYNSGEKVDTGKVYGYFNKDNSREFTFDKNVTVLNAKPTATPTPQSTVKLSLDKKTADVVCGKTLTLKARLAGSTSKVSWKTSDSSVATVDSSGKITAKMAGKVTITATAAGKSAKCTITVLYKDVTNSKDFWYGPTNYLTAKGVVKGYAKQTEFRPANKCTRAQMVTFLYRLQGEPKTKSSTCKFSDVRKTDYFFKPVIWASEKGITTGVSKDKFDPQRVCTRAQTVTFLWRMANKPDPKTKKNPFPDVKKSDYFYKATLWASEKKILVGMPDGTFNPQGKCLRRQMVTFLYKYDKFVNGKG
ncbi:MAG: S-layer homology domain-containing protein [Clostridiales bacterium]|nr:S-layer homology domain-containing protein [Clostridiales bacterium]